MSELYVRTAWLQGGPAFCPTLPGRHSEPHRLILLGAPGVGKGTQAELLCERLGACHLSTGDVFRAARASSHGNLSPKLEQAVDYMRRGELVPDDIVLALVRQRGQCLRCSGGFVLDGFPRTADQAEALQKMLQTENLALTAAIHYVLSPDQILARLSGRRICPGCKAIFHVITRTPQIEGICDHCGMRLFQREDDQPESIRVRLQAYGQSVSPLLDFYQNRGLLISIDADSSPVETYQRTITALTRPARVTSPV